jgi:5-methyltetrahydrofolate--homocysteine methyltransferase
VWVPDASRAVGVAQTLSSPSGRAAYMEQLRADYVKIREQHAKKTGQKSITIAGRARQCGEDRLERYRPARPEASRRHRAA